VAANNVRLYVNKQEGFIGFGLRKDEFVTECSDLDDIIVLRNDGVCKVSRIADKVFMGKDILFSGVFKKNDERQVYNMIYKDGKSGRSLAKRFQVLAVTRDKEYNLTKGTNGSKVLYLTANPNEEAETVTLFLTSGAKARKKVFEFDFATLEIKGRGAGGNIVTRYPVRKAILKSEGASTMGGLDIWYDQVVGRLNREKRGAFLGNFNGDDRVVVIYKDGTYGLTDFELTNRYEPDKVICLDKAGEDTVISAVHQDGANKIPYLKRFRVETTTLGKRFSFINESAGSKLLAATTNEQTMLEYHYRPAKSRKTAQKTVDHKTMIDVKGWKANGNRISTDRVLKARFVLVDPEDKHKAVAAAAPQLQEKTTVKKPLEPATSPTKTGEKDSGFQVGSTIELDVPSQKEQEDQLGLFEQ
jgi:topoisomerase-4 subunit A